MRVQIKKYRSCAGNEDDAFSCTLYLNGKKAALVTYDGWGGMYAYDFTVGGKGHKPYGGPVYDLFKAYVESLPAEECGFKDPRTGGPAMVQPTMDMVVSRAIGVMLEERQLKRWCRKETLFRVRGDAEGTWRRLNLAFSDNEGEVRRWLGEKYGDAVLEIANERFVKSSGVFGRSGVEKKSDAKEHEPPAPYSGA